MEKIKQKTETNKMIVIQAKEIKSCLVKKKRDKSNKEGSQLGSKKKKLLNVSDIKEKL